MTHYKYIGRDCSSGAQTTGSIEAASKNDAIKRIEAMGITPSSVNEPSEVPPVRLWSFLRQRCRSQAVSPNMTTCNACKASISKKAKTCHTCGHPVPKDNSGWVVVLVIGMILFIRFILDFSNNVASTTGVNSISISNRTLLELSGVFVDEETGLKCIEIRASDDPKKGTCKFFPSISDEWKVVNCWRAAGVVYLQAADGAGWYEAWKVVDNNTLVCGRSGVMWKGTYRKSPGMQFPGDW